MSFRNIFQTLDLKIPSPLQAISAPLFDSKSVRFYIKRDDLIHSYLSGNKWRKLKYNLQEAERQGKNTLLSFGGAYSNHIHALAAAGQIFDFKTIGIIRGDEPRELNATLQFAIQQGMELHFVDRVTYRTKSSPAFQSDLVKKFGDVYILPEGGSNQLAVPGCAEIVDELDNQLEDKNYYIATAMGSGGTAAGLLSHCAKPRVLGVAVLKNAGFLRDEVSRLLNGSPRNLDLFLDYHFGGYAKSTAALNTFVMEFKQEYGISIEPIYTGKLFYALFDLVKKDYFPPGSTIVALHTGGLQSYRE